MESIKQKSWFSRNWLWVLPVGGCLTVILIIIFGIGALFFGISSAIKDSTPVEYAIERAENNAEVKKSGPILNASGLPRSRIFPTDLGRPQSGFSTQVTSNSREFSSGRYSVTTSDMGIVRGHTLYGEIIRTHPISMLVTERVLR